jgi:phosphoglycerol transferase MdoB-like AlkP superfamily enzyme
MDREFSRGAAAHRLYWGAVWLAVVLVATKVYYLGVPEVHDARDLVDHARSIFAISYPDLWFVVGFWALARAGLAVLAPVPRAATVLWRGVAALSAFFCLYAVANVVVFGVFGGFLTYPLLALVGDVRMLRSSVGARLSAGVLIGLVAVPALYGAALRLSGDWRLAGRRFKKLQIATAGLVMAWTLIGQARWDETWFARPDRRVGANAEWVFLQSCWQALARPVTVRMPIEFPEADLADFAPLGAGASLEGGGVVGVASPTRTAAVRRPPNVILVVLESVAARWTAVNGGPYETTPTLRDEAAHGVVFENAYAHIGRSSNSLVSILLSKYPKLDFREITEQYPSLQGTSLASVFRDRGYRTAFMTPSDLSWAGWGGFLAHRGFDEALDYRSLTTCPRMLTSWGVEDRCLVDTMVDFVRRFAAQPFFLMAWTTQTHHPYEMSPGVPELNLLKERTPDDWDLGHYLNVVHETDRQLARVFDVVRQSGLERNTLIVVVGDHGQAFGYPHENIYMQGTTAYEEDVRVPLLFWYPSGYETPLRSKTIAAHVDLAPTIAGMAGVAPAADWQGRSLFDRAAPHRAYFYVAEDSFTLGLREGSWKYTYDLRDGTEELFDLDRDPDEQHSVAAAQQDLCRRFRQHLAAWTEANRRQYDQIAGAAGGQ